jgi:hypothetical protein
VDRKAIPVDRDQTMLLRGNANREHIIAPCYAGSIPSPAERDEPDSWIDGGASWMGCAACADCRARCRIKHKYLAGLRRRIHSNHDAG